MSQFPALQTVATLSGGSSPVSKQAFVWGVPGRPFSVGTRGDWLVEAQGVEAIHLFLNFDGRMIQVATGPTGASATLNGAPIDHNWQLVPVFAEIAFGAARIRVTCEETAQGPSVSPPPRQPFEPATAPMARPLEQTDYVRPRQLKTQPLTAQAQHAQVYAQAAPNVLHAAEGAPAPYGAGPYAAPDPGNMASQQPPGAPMPYAPVPTFPSIGPAMNQGERDPISTVSDAGALREHALRVATDPAATHSAYHAQVQRAAVGHDPAGAPHGGAPAWGAPHPALAPGASGSQPAQTMQSAAPLPLPVPEGAAGGSSEAKPEKEKTSWVMRVVLVLLPFAGYFAIFWEPPAPAEDTSSPTATSADPTSANSASSNSKSGAVSSATTAAPAGAAASSNTAPSSSAAIVAGAATAAAAEASSALPAGSAASPNPRLARDALNAAFEGQLDRAIERYDRLSAASGSEVYRVSARLLRERAVRKP